MKDLCLRFADKAEMQLVLIKIGFQEDEAHSGLHHPEIAVDIIGQIQKLKILEDDNSGFITIPGYHVNLRVVNDQMDLSVLDDFIITPSTPIRVWA